MNNHETTHLHQKEDIVISKKQQENVQIQIQQQEILIFFMVNIIDFNNRN